MRLWLCGAAGVVAILCPAALAGSPPRPAPPAGSSVDRLVLGAAQVGRGYVVHRSRGERSLQSVTLDICGFRFSSESQRLQRLQLSYTRPHSPAVSNEAVLYQPGWAQAALGEARNAAAHCSRGSSRGPARGVGPVRYRVNVGTLSGLPDGYFALFVRRTGTVNGRPSDEHWLAVYQVRGDLMSIVYATGGTLHTRERLARHAAIAAAKNLAAVAG
ncbi:MAG TPA: hypothetical protein VGI67_04320 [Thermoleophilaceae bacterium]